MIIYMNKHWQIIIYKTLNGEYPVQEFIDSLELKTQAKVQQTINLLREYGIQLSLPHIKNLQVLSFGN